MKKFLNTKVKDMNAITLIALIITIVVLIILATVVINLSLGDNGIFNRARTAKEQYSNAQEYEKEEIAKASNITETNIYSDRSNTNNYTPTGIKFDTSVGYTVAWTAKTHTAGTFSSSSKSGLTMIKDNENKIDAYLETTSNGYKVLQSGWYFVRMSTEINAQSGADSRCIFYINDNQAINCYAWSNSSIADYDSSSMCVFLSQNDLVYFSFSRNQCSC